MATCAGDIWPRAICAVSSKDGSCFKDLPEPKAVQPKKDDNSVKKRFENLSIDLCRRAIEDCFKGKWGRNDILTFVEKYAGIRRQEFWALWLEDPENMSLRNEAVDAIAPMIMETVEEIEKGHDPEDMEPVTIRPRPDGMTGKIRDIAMLCVLHQILGHVAKLMIDPLLKARIEPTQHASIPGRGQTKLKDQTAKLLRKNPEIRYVVKTDVKSAYKSMTYEVCLGLIRMEIPAAKTAIALIRYLGRIAPDGHLIIGGYLDAWLFNYAMSYAVRFLRTVGKTRRGKLILSVKACETYMDDFALYATSAKDLTRAVRSLQKWMNVNLGVTTKITTGIIKILQISGEQERKTGKGAARTTPAVDMAGYRISRSHVTIRRRVWRKDRRQLLRAWEEYRRDGHLREIRAEKVISCNSYIRQSDSNGIKEKYHVDELMKEAKRVASRRTKRERKEKKERIEHALYGRGFRQAQKGHHRKASGRKKENPSDGQRNKERG